MVPPYAETWFGFVLGKASLQTPEDVNVFLLAGGKYYCSGVNANAARVASAGETAAAVGHRSWAK
jgi:hypothetical protein